MTGLARSLIGSQQQSFSEKDQATLEYPAGRALHALKLFCNEHMQISIPSCCLPLQELLQFCYCLASLDYLSSQCFPLFQLKVKPGVQAADKRVRSLSCLDTCQCQKPAICLPKASYSFSLAEMVLRDDDQKEVVNSISYELSCFVP